MEETVCYSFSIRTSSLMHSYLITGPDNQIRRIQADKLLEELAIDPLERTILAKPESGSKSDSKTKQSIGIEEIKQLQKQLLLKPIRGDKKAIIISDAQSLTTEAQNALLKVLEEPPVHTVFILLSSSEETLLPTVLSRCTIIALPKKLPDISQEEKELLLTICNEIGKMSPAQALSYAEKLSKDKESAALWLEKLIVVARSSLIKDAENRNTAVSRTYVRLIRESSRLHRQITTTNVNLRLSFEHFFLSFT